MTVEYNPHGIPQAYLITFTTYGTWLHGDERGSVDPKHNQFGEEFLDKDHQQEKEELHSLKHKPVYLSPLVSVCPAALGNFLQRMKITYKKNALRRRTTSRRRCRTAKRLARIAKVVRHQTPRFH